MKVLGIETSCDETGVAVYDTDRGLLAEALYSQVAVHAEYGGVVPELASRDHIRKTLPLINEVLHRSGLDKNELEGIAYTAGPGLMGALMVGATLGRSMARGLGIPCLGVHHMEGHTGPNAGGGPTAVSIYCFIGKRWSQPAGPGRWSRSLHTAWRIGGRRRG